MKSIRNKSKLPTMLVKRDGTTCEDEEDMCKEMLDAFFPQPEEGHKLEARMLANQSNKTNLSDNIESRKEAKVEASKLLPEITCIISKLKPRKASGIDGCNSKLIKKYFEARSNVFTAMMERCISLGHFPSCWKTGLVIPIPKGNQEKTYKYFRPITLLPVPGKCLEKLFIEKILTHIKKKWTLGE